MLDHARKTTDIPSFISGHFVDNPASGRVMEKCGFMDTGEETRCPKLEVGADRPVKVMKLTIEQYRRN